MSLLNEQLITEVIEMFVVIEHCRVAKRALNMLNLLAKHNLPCYILSPNVKNDGGGRYGIQGVG